MAREKSDRDRQRAEAAHRRAEHERRKAVVAREKAREEAYSVSINLAQSLLAQGRGPDAEAALAQCPRALRSWEWGFLKGQCRQDCLVFEGVGLWFCLFDQEGKRIATYDQGARIVIVDARTGKVLVKGPEPEAWPVSGDWSRDGRHIAIRGSKGDFFVWDVGQQRKLISVSNLGPCTLTNSVAFSPDGRRVVCIANRSGKANKGTAALIWRVRDGRLEKDFKPTNPGCFQSVAWSPDGAKLAFAGYERADLVVCDLATGQRIGLRESPDAGSSWWGKHRAVAFTPDSKRLAVGMSGSFRILEIEPESLCPCLDVRLPSPDPIHDLQFSPDGRRIAVAQGSEIRICDPRNGRLLWTLRGHPDRVTCLAFLVPMAHAWRPWTSRSIGCGYGTSGRATTPRSCGGRGESPLRWPSATTDAGSPRPAAARSPPSFESGNCHPGVRS